MTAAPPAGPSVPARHGARRQGPAIHRREHRGSSGWLGRSSASGSAALGGQMAGPAAPAPDPPPRLASPTRPGTPECAGSREGLLWTVPWSAAGASRWPSGVSRQSPASSSATYPGGVPRRHWQGRAQPRDRERRGLRRVTFGAVEGMSPEAPGMGARAQPLGTPSGLAGNPVCRSPSRAPDSCRSLPAKPVEESGCLRGALGRPFPCAVSPAAVERCVGPTAKQHGRRRPGAREDVPARARS